MQQSAYNTSTETALLKVKSDILNAVDDRQVVFLVLIDLSAAKLLIMASCSNAFIIRLVYQGQHSKQFKMYLGSRTCGGFIDGFHSDSQPLIYGVPQGSVAVAHYSLFYTHYPLARLFVVINIQFHQYMQMTHNVSFNPKGQVLLKGLCTSYNIASVN